MSKRHLHLARHKCRQSGGTWKIPEKHGCDRSTRDAAARPETGVCAPAGVAGGVRRVALPLLHRVPPVPTTSPPAAPGPPLDPSSPRCSQRLPLEERGTAPSRPGPRSSRPRRGAHRTPFTHLYDSPPRRAHRRVFWPVFCVVSHIQLRLSAACISSLSTPRSDTSGVLSRSPWRDLLRHALATPVWRARPGRASALGCP